MSPPCLSPACSPGPREPSYAWPIAQAPANAVEATGDFGEIAPEDAPPPTAQEEEEVDLC